MKLYCDLCDLDQTVDLSLEATPSCANCGRPLTFDDDFSVRSDALHLTRAGPKIGLESTMVLYVPSTSYSLKCQAVGVTDGTNEGNSNEVNFDYRQVCED